MSIHLSVRWWIVLVFLDDEARTGGSLDRLSGIGGLRDIIRLHLDIVSLTSGQVLLATESGKIPIGHRLIVPSFGSLF